MNQSKVIYFTNFTRHLEEKCNQDFKHKYIFKRAIRKISVFKCKDIRKIAHSHDLILLFNKKNMATYGEWTEIMPKLKG